MGDISPNESKNIDESFKTNFFRKEQVAYCINNICNAKYKSLVMFQSKPRIFFMQISWIVSFVSLLIKSRKRS